MFDKVLKLVEGAIKPLRILLKFCIMKGANTYIKLKKILKIFNVRKYLKFKQNPRKIPVKEVIGINFNVSSCKPKVCLILLHKYL